VGSRTTVSLSISLELTSRANRAFPQKPNHNRDADGSASGSPLSMIVIVPRGWPKLKPTSDTGGIAAIDSGE